MSVDTGTSGATAAWEGLKDLALPVVGVAWISYLGVTCVGDVVLTAGFLAAFGVAMAISYVSESSDFLRVLGVFLLGTVGLGGVGIACSRGEPLIEELLYVVVAGLAVLLHADRQMLR